MQELTICKQHSESCATQIKIEKAHLANTYDPLPVVLSKGEGSYLWDIEDNRYLDFLSSYSAVNQGHCHPQIIKAMIKQASNLTLTSRAFYTDQLGKYAQYITQLFGYDKLLPMNSGAEAVESAIKLVRKWGTIKKGIPKNKSQIIVCQQNFHGRTTTISSFSSNHEAKDYFGPFTPGFIEIEFNNLDALESALSENEFIAGFLVEPIQGEAGVIIPNDDYCQKAKELCTKYNVLFVADEIQTGIARTGSLLATCGECSCNSTCNKNGENYVRPDVLLLGKALSGGTYPISGVLCDDNIMDVFNPGEHGSTFGGNPLASAIAIEALKVVVEECLIPKARHLGNVFRKYLNNYAKSSKIIKSIRGKGLLNAVEINDHEKSKTAWEICIRMKDKGLLAKPTHGNIIRFAPPLVIAETQLHEGINIITETFSEFEI